MPSNNRRNSEANRQSYRRSIAVENYKEIPWKRIIGLRNILSHEYAAIDPEAIFNTIKIGIPPLLATINSIIADIENGKHNSLF